MLDVSNSNLKHILYMAHSNVGLVFFFLHYMVAVPEDAVVMVLLCRIEPEIELLFSSGTDTSVGIDVCLDNPVVPLVMSKKFDVNLVVVVRKHVPI